MGAICGIYLLNGGTVSQTAISAMVEKLKVYTYDKVGMFNKEKLSFGCGMQYITPESEKEVLPLCDKSQSLILTADAIIDNRAELLTTFGVEESLWASVTDSELILMSYRKWGRDCLKYLVGDFAISIWDERKQELFCARDHVGKRTFYYYRSRELFAFCTIIKPLFTVLDHEVELNERWLTDFLAINGVPHETECNETVYKDIYQLPPASTLTINSEGLHIESYWDPLHDVQPLRLKTDEAYEEAFRAVFLEAVSCRLRSSAEVGILLSGGLDSGSIAGVAAKKLSEKNKRLVAFTSIPMAGFKGQASKYLLDDESDEVKALCDYSDNIDANFCRSEGRHSLSDVESYVDILEQPYKIFQNIFWLDNIYKKAKSQGCKVILTGQFGNSTISYGEFLVHAVTLFRKGRILSLIRETVALSKLLHVPLAKVSKIVVRAILPYQLRKTVSILRNANYNRFLPVAVNPDLIKKWDVAKRFDDLDIYPITQHFWDYDESNKWRVNPVAFSHIGTIETKLSLAHGIAIRDPSRDKRVIEFCLSLPSDQYVRNGQERFLIRRAMKGILPDGIRLNMTTRGRQSADWLARLEPYWEDIVRELKEILTDEQVVAFLDKDVLKRELNAAEQFSDEKKADTVMLFIRTIIFARFLKKFQEENAWENNPLIKKRRTGSEQSVLES